MTRAGTPLRKFGRKFGRRTVRKHSCGAGALLGVLLLAAVAGSALTFHYQARGIARGEALDRAGGRVFAAWFLAAHRASQDQAAAFAARLGAGSAIVLTPARLRALGAAPPGLPDGPGRNATFAFGVIADGTPRGVPMAFGILEPAPDGGAAHAVALRVGALGAGLAGLEQGAAGALMAPHLPAIEAALGRPLGPGALHVTADHGLRYLENALYRRAQPGRAYLNRLETGLDMGSPNPANPADPGNPGNPTGRNIVRAGTVTARAADLSGDAEIGGKAVADATVTAQRLAAADLVAREVGGAALSVFADLTVGQAVTGPVAAGSVNAAGRLDAGGLRLAGTLSAQTLSAATAVAIAGAAAVAGRVDGEEAKVGGDLRAGGIAAGAAHGPAARIDGLMTVGSCGGC